MRIVTQANELNPFSSKSFLKLLLFILILAVSSCQQDSEKSSGSQVGDWNIPCDLSKLCNLKELLSSLNGPVSFKQQLKSQIDARPEVFKKAYGIQYYYICAKLIEVGGCQKLDVRGKLELELFTQGLASCHHFRCHEYFEKNKGELLGKINAVKSVQAQKYYYLMAVKLPIPWFDKAQYLTRYLELIDGNIIKYEELGPLISAIPNHQGLKSFVAKNFFKIDKHLDAIAVYLARYQNGWHDIYYKSFVDRARSDATHAFVAAMPIGCPRLTTVLAFKNEFNSDNRRILQETLKQSDLDKYFKNLKAKQNIGSKCFSSSQPVF